eukprot:Skav222746  [mRNA]  locus=scaffold2390:557469:561422:- [translate_table: standard]
MIAPPFSSEETDPPKRVPRTKVPAPLVMVHEEAQDLKLPVDPVPGDSGRGQLPVPQRQKPSGKFQRHHKAGDCWTIFQGRVYDITLYIDFHPGGKRQIMQGAGKDMTTLFQKAHPWVSGCPSARLERCEHSCYTPG